MPAAVTDKVDGRYGSQQALVIVDCDTITVADLPIEILLEHTRRAPDLTYVTNSRPRGGRPPTAQPP